MSYEQETLLKYNMPSKEEVASALLQILLKHGGKVKEFSLDQEIVLELAVFFGLNEEQRTAILERLYRKDNRKIKSLLWHRLLYRAADLLAKQKLVTNPSTTFALSGRKEWMLTELGFDKSNEILKLPPSFKENSFIKSYEVEKLSIEKINQKKPENYIPFGRNEENKKKIKEFSIRERSFRNALLNVYAHKCSVCGFQLKSPNGLIWEVEAAHIIPHGSNGKDDIWNGLALCHLHHWAFDVGWFSIDNNYKIILSDEYFRLPQNFGNIFDYNFFQGIKRGDNLINLPINIDHYPDLSALKWHRENVLFIK